MDRAVELVLDRLEKAVVDLQSALSTHHGFYRGTYDSVLTEVQEGVMLQAKGGGTAISHLTSLEGGLAAARNGNDAATKALRELSRLDHKAAGELSDTLAPLLKMARSKIDLGERTLDLVREIQINHPKRLTGVPLNPKGRTVGALTSTQLDNLGIKAVPPGLVANPKVKGLLAEIARQPLDGKGLANEVEAANRLVKAALERKLTHSATTGTRRFAGNLSARFSISGHLLTPAGIPGANPAVAALKREQATRLANKAETEALQAAEKKMAAWVAGKRGKLAKAAARQLLKIAQSKAAKRALSVAPVIGWGFSASDAWAGGKDVFRGNVARGLSGIGLAVVDVASDLLHLGDAVSGVGGTALSVAVQGGTIAGQVKVEMDRVQEQMDRVLAEVDRTGALPPDSRLKSEFELDDDTITELKQAMTE